MTVRRELCVVQAVALARCAADPALRAEMANAVLDRLHQAAQRAWVHTDPSVIPALQGQRSGDPPMPFALDPFDEALALAITRFRRRHHVGAVRSRHAWVDAGWLVIDAKGWRHRDRFGTGADRGAHYRLVPTEFSEFEAAVRAWDAAPPVARAVLRERLEFRVDLPRVPADLPRRLVPHVRLHMPERATELNGCACAVSVPRGGGLRRTLRLVVHDAEAMLRLTGAQQQGHWLSFSVVDAATAGAAGERHFTHVAFPVPPVDVPGVVPAWASLPDTGLPYLSTLVQPQLVFESDALMDAVRQHRWVELSPAAIQRLMTAPTLWMPSRR